MLLVSRDLIGNIVELTFDYRVTNADSKIVGFTGKHVQAWENQKIVREEYFSIE